MIITHICLILILNEQQRVNIIFFFSQVNYYGATLRLIGSIRGQQQQQHDLVYAFEVVLLDRYA